ncbi:Phosphoglycerate dehydrogenase [Carpediemonas membranifera]|uniref:Phosphoglycerate dehydrogenase n=1 Tax=Carpediemonas membranifera TaxID=201153 RepID=A0A8J6B513_9EUKA|nr:Phosphoglycerate dehydrogenase [Carpediemonas membranifera]|eukprot:KAG9394429.1 Phosphoglycerate dehydrogenase [Carpediemonas membranifera]
MFVLAADKVDASAVEAMTAMGYTVDVDPKLTDADLPAHIEKYNILIVRSTKVKADTIAAAKNLKMVIRAGAGTSTIDVKAAAAAGIPVCNTPGRNAAAVAELAIGMLVCCDRRMPRAMRHLAQGEWKKGSFQVAHGLRGRTLGVVGRGFIARYVVEGAKGLGMKVKMFSAGLTEEDAKELGVEKITDKNELASCDAVSVHMAYSANKPETFHFIDADFLGKMRDGAILVNCARGEVVDTAALKEAIKTKGLRVGCDVYENEPVKADDVFVDTELAELVEVATPHIGASTNQASEAVGEEVVRMMEVFIKDGKVENCVNM